MSELKIQRVTQSRRPPSFEQLGFGEQFTDHMFLMDYDEEGGWSRPRIVPYGPLKLEPAAAVLHYAQAVFDGLKAFRGTDGSIRLFRPVDHADRLNRSCDRLCIPRIDPELLVWSFRQLLRVDASWVPEGIGRSLYLRPAIIATEPFLGVRPAKKYTYFLILSPVGSYYSGGRKPLRIFATDKYVRAVEGGIGSAKTAGNYAASLFAATEAHRLGYSQVLWLDGVHRKYIDEVGTMNIMVRLENEVVTPPLSDSILPRDSALALLRSWSVNVSERPLAITELFDAVRAGNLREIWGTGTAAVVSPIGEIAYRNRQLIVPQIDHDSLSEKLYEALTGIQYGITADAFRWTEIVD
jgi:branched-chain amino acid aminotransferase